MDERSGEHGLLGDNDLEELAEVFGKAWNKERERIGRGIAPKGSKTKAGLRAVFDKIAEDGYHLEPDA